MVSLEILILDFKYFLRFTKGQLIGYVTLHKMINSEMTSHTSDNASLFDELRGINDVL